MTGKRHVHSHARLCLPLGGTRAPRRGPRRGHCVAVWHSEPVVLPCCIMWPAPRPAPRSTPAPPSPLPASGLPCSVAAAAARRAPAAPTTAAVATSGPRRRVPKCAATRRHAPQGPNRTVWERREGAGQGGGGRGGTRRGGGEGGSMLFAVPFPSVPLVPCWSSRGQRVCVSVCAPVPISRVD